MTHTPQPNHPEKQDSSPHTDELRERLSDFTRTKKVYTPDGWELKELVELDEVLNLFNTEVERHINEAKKEAYQLGLMTGAMPESIGKPMAEEYLAELRQQGEKHG